MSYAPIYAKLRDLEERLIKIETFSPALPVVDLSTGIDLTSLLNECTLNSSSITQLSNTIAMLATKEELVHLATKDPSTNNDVSSHVIDYLTAISKCATKEELVPLATKEELVPLATKEELVPLATKEELVPLATKEELVPLATKEELVPLATKDELVPLATKDELVPLATKDELVPLATKDELVPLATKEELVSKDELANLFAKFDNIINVVAQLNTRIDDLYTKIPVSA